MTSFGENSLNIAITDIKTHCIISASKDKGNLWTDWDAIKLLLYINLAIFSLSCFIELFCTQISVHRQLFKPKKDVKKTERREDEVDNDDDIEKNS